MVIDVVRRPIDLEDVMIAVTETHSLPAQPTQPRRKLIAAPVLNLSVDDEDDDDLSDISPPSPRLGDGSFLSGPLSTHTHASLLATPVDTPASPPQPASSSPFSRVAYDLATYGGSGAPPRRHSITVCQTPAHTSTGSSRASSGHASPTSTAKPFFSNSKTQIDFLSSAHFSTRLDCLSLTLEEVVHIRNVLTKADLDALPLDLSIKEDVAKGKICFICMKSRFSFWGAKGSQCRLCKRIVCKKCLTRMRIPTEHFSNIPVAILTPQALSPKEEEDMPTSLQRSFYNMLPDFQKPVVARKTSLTGSVGSAPSSPSPAKKTPLFDTIPPAPCVARDIRKKEQIRLKSQEVEERLRGELMAVCLDCKAMVVHVLLSIKHRKQNHTATDRDKLHLNLTPVYN